MIVCTQNQDVSANITIIDGALEIAFSDPSFVRSDMIILHSSNSGVVALHHEGYHQICALPHDLDFNLLAQFKDASLVAELSDGSRLSLNVPLCIKQ